MIWRRWKTRFYVRWLPSATSRENGDDTSSPHCMLYISTVMEDLPRTSALQNGVWHLPKINSYFIAMFLRVQYFSYFRLYTHVSLWSVSLFLNKIIKLGLYSFWRQKIQTESHFAFADEMQFLFLFNWGFKM